MIGPKPICDLTRSERTRILLRSSLDVESVRPYVSSIIEDVRKGGDEAVIRYTARFDKVLLKAKELRVSEEEIQVARELTSKDTIKALEKARRNIETFHRRQVPPESWLTEVENGVLVGQLRRPIPSVGLYIPGGKAAYPSTVLMTAIPARVAGVPKIIACTPPSSDGRANPLVLVASDIAGVHEIYKVGGPQAIAAMAYGTETIPKVDKIVGPGNVYVTAAKLLVYGVVDVDFPAGPSEVLILADESADPGIVARDLVSQAEHDPDAAAVLVTTCEKLAKKVRKILEKIVKRTTRSEIIIRALRKNGALLIAENLREAIDFVNEYAPEHLEIMLSDYKPAMKGIKNAGSIFIGPYSAVSAGDYCTGANHVLPTGGMAKVYSGLSVDDFIKRPTIQFVDREGLKNLRETIITLARAENLPSHAEAIEVRLKNE